MPRIGSIPLLLLFVGCATASPSSDLSTGLSPTVAHAQTASEGPASERAPDIDYQLPDEAWQADSLALPQGDRSIRLMLKHRGTDAVVIVRVEPANGRVASGIAMAEMIARAQTGAEVGGFAEDPHADRWGTFVFLYDRSMFGQCMVFHDREHPEWIIIVTGSWDMLRDRDDLMSLHLDGIATYLRVVP